MRLHFAINPGFFLVGDLDVVLLVEKDVQHLRCRCSVADEIVGYGDSVVAKQVRRLAWGDAWCM